MYTEEQLKEKATELFEQFPTATELYATTDGNIFTMQNRARLHAGVKGRVLTIARPLNAEPAAEEAKGLNAADTIKAIAVATLEALEAFANDERATVKKAYEKRKKELEATPGTIAEATATDANGEDGHTGTDTRDADDATEDAKAAE